MGQITRHLPLGAAGGIAEYHGAIDERDCTELVSCLTEEFSTLFESGPTLGGINSLMKNSMDTSFMNAEQYGPHLRYFRNYSELCTKLDSIVWSCVADYIQFYKELWYAPNIHCTGFRIQRYERNAGFYRTHCDATSWTPINDGTDTVRVLAVVVYLNDVHEGGGTHFPIHDFTTTADVGKVVIFPTTWQYPHMGQVPLSNDKWIISQFINASIEHAPNMNIINDDVFVEPTVKSVE